VSPKLRQIKAKQLVAVALKIGFVFDRQSGGHAVYYHKSNKRRIVVPVHPRKEIKLKTLLGIIKDMGLEPDEFLKLL
jgi:predicted RNA binding protein YcfA (HicA-like mRNA interferase family)